jgi:hypothetical protein
MKIGYKLSVISYQWCLPTRDEPARSALITDS